MANEESGTLTQARRILSDQETGLRELRSKRSDCHERLADMAAKEIEYLIGIERTKETIKKLEEAQ